MHQTLSVYSVILRVEVVGLCRASLGQRLQKQEFVPELLHLSRGMTLKESCLRAWRCTT